MNNRAINLVEKFQSEGKYFFTRREISAKIKLSDCALTFALNRLQKKGRISRVRNGFYIIIPLEYKKSRGLPASWFIDDLMKYLGKPYYTGLLSAAAIYGAKHQAPNVFQVITDKPMREIDLNGLKICFFMKSKAKFNKWINSIKTETGFIRVSSPELTALDLVKYPHGAGGLNNIATVLAELSEKIDYAKLIEMAKKEKILVFVQRLCYLLDEILGEKGVNRFYQLLKKEKMSVTPLNPGIKIKTKSPKKLLNKKWKIIVNCEISPDL